LSIDFGSHDDVVFKKAPLLTVLCQIQFEPVLSLMSPVGVSGFQEGIRAVYPHFSPSQAANVAVTTGNRSRIDVSQEPPIWRMRDLATDWHWRVSIGVNFISLETHRYTDFGEFLERLMFLLGMLERTVKPSDATRIGLRKVNSICVDRLESPTEWTRYLRPELLSLIAMDLPRELASSLTDIRIKDGVNEFVVRHGFAPSMNFDDIPGVMIPGDQTGELQHLPSGGKGNESQYLVDIDYSSPVPYPIGRNEAISELLREFSEGITSFFHWAIQPDLVRLLEPVSRGEVPANASE